MAKFDRASRTFETRVGFIRDVFSSKYQPIEIMAHCIKYKLDKSYEVYLKDILKSVWNLDGQDPMKILKRVDRDMKEI
jgi:predicted GTPase